MRAVAGFPVIDAEDGRAVEAAVRLARGLDLFAGRELAEGVVHSADRIVIAVEESLK